MPCPRCGAQFREDPSCGKSEHLDLPSRDDQDPRQPYPAANPPLVKLAAQIQVGEYFHDLWIFTPRNQEGEDANPDVTIHVTSRWGEILVEGEGDDETLFEGRLYSQWVGALLHRMMVGDVVTITPELEQELIDEGFFSEEA